MRTTPPWSSPLRREPSSCTPTAGPCSAPLPFLGAVGAKSIDEARALLTEVAGSRPLAAEVFCEAFDVQAFTHARQRLGVSLPACSRLHVVFWGQAADERTRAFAASMGHGQVHRNSVLFENVERRKRIAVLGLRHGGSVKALDGSEVQVNATFWFVPPPRRKGIKAEATPTIDPDALQLSLAAALGPHVRCSPGANGTAAGVRTDQPALVIMAMEAEAVRLGCEVWTAVTDLDPLAQTLRRLVADLG